MVTRKSVIHFSTGPDGDAWQAVSGESGAECLKRVAQPQKPVVAAGTVLQQWHSN